MDQREEEILLNVACGLDPLTAIAASADDDPKPPKKPSGCLFIVLMALSVYWLLR